MGSWTVGTLGALGLAGDLATNVGSLVLGAENNQINQQLANLQTQALQMNLQLQQQALNLSKDWNDPGSRYNKALAAGYDPISARQVAGAGFTHFQGGVSMHPIKAADATNLKYNNMAHQGLTAGRAYTVGVGKTPKPSDFYNAVWMHQGGQDNFTGNGEWRPPSSSWRGSISSQSSLSSRNWGSTSTRSTAPSIPSWAAFSMTSTPPGSIRVVPGTATRPGPVRPSYASIAGSIRSLSLIHI